MIEEEYDEGSQIPDSELGEFPDNSSSSYETQHSKGGRSYECGTNNQI